MKEAKAEDIFEKIVEFFNDNNILYKENLIGFASDGASVMVGVRNSVMSRLKTEIPHIFLLKCICHSFHLCASSACSKLPKGVEDVTRDVYNYIANSPKRVQVLKEFQVFTQTKIHKILHPSQTRWLSLENVVCRIIEQYNALKLFFTDAVAIDRLLAAESILEKLQDPLTYLFLLFLEHVLPLFNNCNREMQSSEPKLFDLHNRMTVLYKTFLDFFIKREIVTNVPLHQIDVRNPHNYKNIENIYLGAKINAYILQNNISPAQLNILRVRCLDFYVEGATQIVKRFDFASDVLKAMHLLDPKIIFKGDEESLMPLVSHFPNLVSNDDLQSIDNEWRLLKNSNLKFDSNDSICSFWVRVKNEKYMDETLQYPLLSNFALNVLSLPHSSANAERVFSQVNLLKTKQRNSLSTNTIVGLLHSKSYIGENCFDVKISKDILSRHNQKMYEKSETLSDSE